MLSPNALRVLDSLDVYEKIKKQGYNFETCSFKTSDGETKGVYYFGHEKIYGYKGLRIYRMDIFNTLRSMLEERKVLIHFGKKFSHVVSESEENVTFQFADGSEKTTPLLVGADGIHSKVRRYIYPGLLPSFSGIVAVTSAIPRSAIRLPENDPNYSLPAQIATSTGGFILAPQGADGSELLIGRQHVFAERNRQGWDDLNADKKQLAALIQSDIDSQPDIVKSALEAINPERIQTWPFYTVPRLESWSSKSNRVVILGDAAHAIPPTTGQGVNQAFEDIYVFALLLGKQAEELDWDQAIKLWQSYRVERVDRLLELTRKLNNNRLPLSEQMKLAKNDVWNDETGKGDPEEMSWLFGPTLDNVVKEWVSSRSNINA